MNLAQIQEIYDISCLGFLPEKCEKNIPFGWIFLKPALVILGTSNGDAYREVIKSIKPKEIPSTVNLTLNETKYIQSVLGFIIQKYIWCKGPDGVTDTVPEYLGRPWKEVCDKLGLPIALTYAVVDLYNWSLKNPTKKFCLDNLKSDRLLLSDPSEEWFYLTMVAIEGRGGCAILPMVAIGNLLKESSYKESRDEIIKNLIHVRNSLHEIKDIIPRMREKCVPEFFFNEHRIYLSGSDKKEYFPRGLILENVEHDPISMKSGSAAQSSLIQVFDRFFNIEHKGSAKTFLDEMKEYMPKKHADFIDFMKYQPDLLEFINQDDDEDMRKIYQECISFLNDFRKTHFAIVHEYIYKFISKEPKLGTCEKSPVSVAKYKIDANLEDKENSKHIQGSKGTGGTDPKKFLGSVNKNTIARMAYANSKVMHVDNTIAKGGNIKPKSKPTFTPTPASCIIPVICAYAVWYCIWQVSGTG